MACHVFYLPPLESESEFPRTQVITVPDVTAAHNLVETLKLSGITATWRPSAARATIAKLLALRAAAEARAIALEVRRNSCAPPRLISMTGKK